MRNRKKFERAGMIDPGAELTPEQSDAVENLTAQEVESLISAKKKLNDAWRGAKSRGIIGPIKARKEDDDREEYRGRSTSTAKATTKATKKAKK